MKKQKKKTEKIILNISSNLHSGTKYEIIKDVADLLH